MQITAVDPFILRQLAAETEARAHATEAPVSTATGAPAELMAALAAAARELAPTLVAA